MKTGFFEEKPGQRSSMRLYSFISLLTGCSIAIYSVVTKQLDINTISLITMFVVGCFAPKAVQKFAEK